MTESVAGPHIEISLSQQRLWLKQAEEVLLDLPVSTAKNGAGEVFDSECTPRGLHEIHAKFGAGCQPNTVFVGRRPTGETYTPDLQREFPDRDWILTRILWLTGMEPGRNQGGNVDSRRRHIYIHGTPHEISIGVPGSHGCIRMRNRDVIELFDKVDVGTRVAILE